MNKEQNNDLVQGLTIEELDTSDGSQTHVPDAVAEDMVTKPDVCDKDEELVKTADVILTDVPDDMEMDTNHECVSNSSEVSKNELGKSTSPIEEISAVDSLVTKD